MRTAIQTRWVAVDAMSRYIPPVLLIVGRLIHFLGFALAVGGCVAALIVFRANVADTARRVGIDQAAATIVTKVEIVGAFVALIGGILLVVANPNVLDPGSSGAGPWLHVKLAFVFGALVLAHIRMFNLHSLMRENEDGGVDAAAMRTKGQRLDIVTVLLYAVVLLIVLTRFVVFA